MEQGSIKGQKSCRGGVPKGMLNVCEGAAWKCNFPMSPHVRPLVVWSGWSVGWSVCHNFSKRAGSYTSMMILSGYLLITSVDKCGAIRHFSTFFPVKFFLIF